MNTCNEPKDEKSSECVSVKPNSLGNSGNTNAIVNNVPVEAIVNRYLSIVDRTAIYVTNLKRYNIISGGQLTQCMSSLKNVSSTLSGLKTADAVSFLTDIQNVNNDLSNVMRFHGTWDFKDLVMVCLGKQYAQQCKINESIILTRKWDILSDFFHPIGYCVYHWKDDCINMAQILSKYNIDINSSDKCTNTKTKTKNGATTPKTHPTMFDPLNENVACYDLMWNTKQFFLQVYGILVVLHYPQQKKTLVITGYVDDIPLWGKNIQFLQNIIDALYQIYNSNTPSCKKCDLEYYTNCLTIKDVLVNTSSQLWFNFIGLVAQATTHQSKSISSLVKEFLNTDAYAQRTILLQLLIKSNEPRYKYLAYLLYDLLSNDNGVNVDTQHQTTLFNSLPNSCKRIFKDALTSTIEYASYLNKFDSSKIPLEQQICLMKAPESVKEKAMQKLKEFKNKKEESGNKARQYLEGLLKIPFGIYRVEPILTIMNSTKDVFSDLCRRLMQSPFHSDISSIIPAKQRYTTAEIHKYVPVIKNLYETQTGEKASSVIIEHVNANLNRQSLTEIIHKLNSFIKMHSIKHRKIPHSGRSISKMTNDILAFIDEMKKGNAYMTSLGDYIGITKTDIGQSVFNILGTDLQLIETNMEKVSSFMESTHNTLTKAVHGHNKAKRQVERIIGQWINGEQSGYCFGFEGPPGVGKTSLAKKGIAKCLEDIDGTSRPFAFIAIGGATNGSTLEGHNYTYVASTWGKIVDVLMDTKCMNPIIFIDELDKVSRTEHGREIIGILTHLIDSTQNDSFQDKYFNGIDIDLSRALFIFSYNDVDAIDQILLDRIHRVKFSPLTLDDKLVISKDYILHEVLEKMGMTGIVTFTDDVLEYIIETYTAEPGVRKLKELLFEIVSEMNLATLKDGKVEDIPIEVTIDMVKNKYLKDRDFIRPYVIQRQVPTIGVINGLYANQLGFGGVLPIEVSLQPSGSFLELQLTGLQGDVMKESMSVAKTLAISRAMLCLDGSDKNCIDSIALECEKRPYKHGIHVHVPSGGTKKDGPSAGTAITIAIYSLLTKKPIRHDVAITGEMCLSGLVTAIGGLEQKILGGIKAGVKTFAYPKENDKDFDKFMELHGHKKNLFEGITFHSIETLDEAMDIAIME